MQSWLKGKQCPGIHIKHMWGHHSSVDSSALPFFISCSTRFESHPHQLHFFMIYSINRQFVCSTCHWIVQLKRKFKTKELRPRLEKFKKGRTIWLRNHQMFSILFFVHIYSVSERVKLIRNRSLTPLTSIAVFLTMQMYDLGKMLLNSASVPSSDRSITCTRY